jgi:hypothetical protein
VTPCDSEEARAGDPLALDRGLGTGPPSGGNARTARATAPVTRVEPENWRSHSEPDIKVGRTGEPLSEPLSRDRTSSRLWPVRRSALFLVTCRLIGKSADPTTPGVAAPRQRTSPPRRGRRNRTMEAIRGLGVDAVGQQTLIRPRSAARQSRHRGACRAVPASSRGGVPSERLRAPRSPTGVMPALAHRDRVQRPLSSVVPTE